MSDTTVDTSTATTTTEPPATETGDKPVAWYKSELEKVRKEAAGHRTSKNDAVEAAKTEVTDEWTAKFEKVEGEKDQLQVSYLKLMAALPQDQKESVVKFASLLQGDSAEALEAHAEEVRSLFGGNSPKPQPALDKTPSGQQVLALNSDGLEEALARAVGAI